MKLVQTVVPVRMRCNHFPPRTRKPRSGLLAASAPVVLRSYGEDELPVVATRVWPIKDPDSPTPDEFVRSDFRIMDGRLATRIFVRGTGRAVDPASLVDMDVLDEDVRPTNDTPFFENCGLSTIVSDPPRGEEEEILGDLSSSDDVARRTMSKLVEEFSRDVFVVGNELWSARGGVPVVRYWSHEDPAGSPKGVGMWMRGGNDRGMLPYMSGECWLSLQDLSAVDTTPHPWAGSAWIDPAVAHFFEADVLGTSVSSLYKKLVERVGNVDVFKSGPEFLRRLADVVETTGGAAPEELKDPEGVLPARIAALATLFTKENDRYGHLQARCLVGLATVVGKAMEARRGSAPDREADALDDEVIGLSM